MPKLVQPEDPNEIKFVAIKLNKCIKMPLGEIKPELYSKKQQNVLRTPQDNKNVELCGKLYFALKYDKELESLIVKLFGASDLPAKDINGLCDPYVNIFLPPNKKKKFQTRVRMKNRNPVFDETFMFSVNYEDLRKRHLQFSVYDFDRFSKHDLIGHVIFQNLDEIADLRQEVEYTMDIIHPPKDLDELGEINICLCYLPTAQRLTITILKGHKLKAMDLNGKSDPYVKVYLIHQGKILKKKKTHVRHKTLSPVFNEALVFHVDINIIKNIKFAIQVIDYDRISQNDLMGCLLIGSHVSGQPQGHWKEMLEKPRKHVSRWYSLVESLPDDIPSLKEPKNSIHFLKCFRTV